LGQFTQFEENKVNRSSSFNFSKNQKLNNRDFLFLQEEKMVSRQVSKTQPIPMKQLHQQQYQQQQQLALNQQRNSHDNIDESSAEEGNSSSVASTPDTIYYFKLKSAAFVPSSSFSNNYSTSFGNLSNENNNMSNNSSDLPPFITLLSADFSNLSANERQQNNQQAIDFNQMAQSPPPPQTLIEYNPQQQQQQKMAIGKPIKSRNNSSNFNANFNNANDHMSSPCSLPNFKMLDTYNQQFINNFNAIQNPNQSSNMPPSHPSSNNQNDDFVFVDSVGFYSYLIFFYNFFLCFFLKLLI
jgi:hypothetical protein